MHCMARKDAQRTFRLPADLDQKLVKKAEALDRSPSWVILRSLEVALEGKEAAHRRALVRGASKK